MGGVLQLQAGGEEGSRRCALISMSLFVADGVAVSAGALIDIVAAVEAVRHSGLHAEAHLGDCGARHGGEGQAGRPRQEGWHSEAKVAEARR